MSSEFKVKFIVGPHRSGTTYIQSLLGTVENIGVLPETHFYCRILPYLEKINKKREVTFEDIKFATIQIPFAGKDYIENWTRLKNAFDKDGYRGYFLELLNKMHFCYNGDAQIILEKTPSHLLFINQILKHFPEASFLITIRDPRSIFISFIKYIDLNSKWVRLRYLIKEVNYLVKVFSEIKSLDGNKYKIIRLEDLQTHKNESLIDICKFLNINFEEGDFDKFTELAYFVSFEHETHKKNNQKVIKEFKFDLWKKVLTRTEIWLIEFFMQDFIRFYKYTFHVYKGKSSLYHIRKIFPILNFIFGYKSNKFKFSNNKLIKKYIPYSPKSKEN